MMIKEVEVIQDFPGYKVGDVLRADTAGNFEFINSSDDAFGALEAVLVSHKPTLRKSDIMQYLGKYFKDITKYAPASEHDVEKRINDLKHWMSEYKDDGIAQTVWQNLIWELEWVLGKRSIGETK